MNKDDLMEKYGWVFVVVCIILAPFLITAALPVISAVIVIAVIVFIVFTTPIWLLLFIDAFRDIILFILKAGFILIICYLVYAIITGKSIL